MHSKFVQLPVYFALVILLAGTILTGCSSSSAGQEPAATQPGATQPAAQVQQTGAGATTGQQGGQKGGTQGGQDMQALQKKMLARVAEILGVPVDSLTTAYQDALKSVSGSSGSGTQGTPPSGSAQGTPPAPPTDNKTGGPGGQGRVRPDMTAIYGKVATTLGLTTEKVQAAFEQAQKELMPAKTQ